MSRATNAPATRARRAKRIKLVKGARGGRKLYRSATEGVNRKFRFAYIHRKKKKTDYRQLWITRISAVVRDGGMNYSSFIDGLYKAEAKLNRKTLAHLAVYEPEIFGKLMALAGKKS